MLRLAVLALCVALAPAAARAGKVPDECNPPERTAELWQRTNLQFLIVGEYHGTAQIPAAFAEIVCSALASGRKVLVGLEFPEPAMPAFRTYLNSSGTVTDRNRLMEAAFLSKYDDGTTSTAIFEATERFRQWRQADMPLSVTTFQRTVKYDPAAGQTPHEKGMAASLLKASAQNPEALVIVLVGNLHARTKPITASAVPFEPMAMHLPPERTLTLVAVHKGGQAWNCRMPQPGETMKCGPGAVRPTTLGRDAQPGLKLGLGPSAAYDGFVKLGRLTASPPVKPLAAQ